MSENFDYEAVTWGGGGLVSPNVSDFLDHSLHLRYALEALLQVSGPVVEVGCGSARFIASIAAQRPDLTTHGCDLSQNALVAAKGHSSTQFVRGSALELPYRSQSFSAVLMIDVLEHLPDLALGLREVRRILKPGAPFHLVFPCEGSRATLHGWWKTLRDLKRRHAGHIQQIGPRALMDALRSAEFEIVDTRYSYHALGQLYDVAVFGAMGLGFNVHAARQAKVETSSPSALKMVRAGLSRLLYAESRLFSRLGFGMTAHVTSR